MGRNNIAGIKNQVLSVIDKGKDSELVNCLINECEILSEAYLVSRVERYKREKIINNYGYNGIRNLATDCIAELFEEKEGYYYKINNFFSYSNFNPAESEAEITFSKLRTLVWSATSARIYELSNPLYVKIRKSLKIFIERNPGYIITNENEKEFLSRINGNFQTEQIKLTSENITEILLYENETNNTTPQLIELIFNYIDETNKFCEFIEINELIGGITEYHLKRMDRELEEEEGNKTAVTTRTMYEERFIENLNEYIGKRKSNYKTIQKDLRLYVYTCKKKELNFEHPVYNRKELQMILYSEDIRNIELEFILQYLFNKINTNDKYLKAALQKVLGIVLSDFYIIFLYE